MSTLELITPLRRTPRSQQASHPKRLLLVNPTRAGFDSYCTAPLHLLYIARAAEDAGHTVEILDLHYALNQRVQFKWEGLSKADKIAHENALIEEVLARNYDVLGIGSIVSSYAMVERLVQQAKSQHPHRPVILGGALGTTLHELWFKHSGVEYLVEADGEHLITELLAHLGDDDYLRTLPGVYVRTANGFQVNRPELPKSLDYIQPPKWETIDWRAYAAIQKEWVAATLPHGLKPTAQDVILPIVATRGCPYHCTFCYHQMNDWERNLPNSYRKHSVDYLLTYIESLQRKFGVTMLVTWDDLIMTDRAWFMNFLDALIGKRWNLQIFTSGGKANIVTRDMCVKMKQAGFTRISYGIETGSPSIIKSMKKGHTVQDNRNAITWAREAGLHVHANMIVGMPGENKQTLKETTDFLCGLDLHASNISFAYATAYPGTELFAIGQQMGLIGDVRDFCMKITGVGEYKVNFSEVPVSEIQAYHRTIGYIVQRAWLWRRQRYGQWAKVVLALWLNQVYFAWCNGTTLDAWVKTRLLPLATRRKVRSFLLQDQERVTVRSTVHSTGEAKVSASC